ncbi:MAG: prealbumin-like fold domain-containing protein [Propionibacteriaceae bacterium]|nr:prealbumin-like fold domain-containing protein [Propionibacteriaceae bacterium]
MKGGVYKAGDEAEATLIGTMSGQPGLYKYYNGEHRDNYRDVTAGRVLEGESAYMAGSEKDVVFTYGASGEYKRNVDQFTLTDTLPTYTDAAGVLRYAEFIAANNPGWTVIEWDADGDAATSDTVTADPGGAGVPSKLSYTGSPGVVHLLSATMLPKLKLRFPLARVPQSVTNSACLAATVNNREDQSAAPYTAQVDPEEFNACDPVSLTLTGTSTRGMYAKSSAGPHQINGYYFFYDDPVEKAAIFAWGLGLSNTLEEPLSDIVYTDRDLDSRMYFYGVRNPLAVPATGRTQTYDAQVIAYDSGGNVLLDETVTEYQYLFPSDLGGGKTPRDIDHIEVQILGYTLPAGASNGISVLTKLRDTAISYESESEGAGVTFRNESDCAFSYTDANGTRQYQVSGGNETHIKDPDNQLGVGKSSQIVGNKPILSGGEQIDYTLSLSGERTPGAYPEDFVVVDLLPKEVEFVSFTPSSMLADSIGYSYQVVGDYQGTGQSAVIIQADRLRLSSTGQFTAELGTIRVQFGYFVYDKARAGFENDVYMSTATDTDAEFTLQGTVADPFDTKLNGGDPISHAQAGDDALVAMTFELWKQVRTVNLEQPELSGAFSSIGTGAKASEAGKPKVLEYKLNIYNNTEAEHQDFVLYDIFPFVGDKMYDKTITGADKARHSEFRDTLYCLPDPGPGWTVYVTRDVSAVNSRDWVREESHWELYDTSAGCPNSTLADVRGIKLVSDYTVVLAEGEGFDYTYQMLSPLDPDGSLIGARAYNSFGEQDNLNPDPLESNAVYNQVLPPTGAIMIKKVTLEGEGLAGAELELVDLATNTRVGGIKVSRADDPDTVEDETGLVTWTNVPIGNYAVREVTAPEGYERTVAEITVRLEDLLAMGDGFVYDVTEAEPLANSPLPPDPKKASVTVQKVDASGQPLAGASFTIVGTDDGSIDGYPDNRNVSYRRVTNKSGVASFEDLPLGNYRVTETAPPGHLMNNWAGAYVELDEDGENVVVGPVVNSKAEFTLVKIGIFDAGYMARPNIELDSSMGKRLAGVPFALYDAVEYAAYLDAEAVSPGSGTLPTPVATGVTNSQGELYFGQLDPNRHYTLVEDTSDLSVTGPGGTAQPLFVGRGSGDDKNRYDVFITLAGELMLDGLKVGTKNLVVGNNGQSTVFRVAIAKVDQHGDAVPGVVFRLATTTAGANAVTFTTDASGLVEITEDVLNALPASTAKTNLLAAYNANSPLYVIEYTAPSGYAIPSGQASWIVYKDSGYQSRTFTNWKLGMDLYKYTSLTATTDATVAYLSLSQSLTGAALDTAIAQKLAEQPGLTVATVGGEKVLRRGIAGAEIRVAQTSPACALTDANKYNPATGSGCWFTAVSDSMGALKAPEGFTFVAANTYTAVETKAPKGYKLDETAQTFRPNDYLALVGFDGTVHLTLANEPELGQVRITKLSKQGGKVLEGVVFELYDADENPVAQRTTDRNGNAAFSSLPYGTYKLKEVETLEGYRLLDTTWTAEVGPDSKSVYFVIYNDETQKLSSLQVTKEDDEGSRLKGLRFYLQTLDMTASDPLDTSAIWSDYTVNDGWGIASKAQPRASDPNGYVTFGQLPAGFYRLVEATADPKYRAPKCETEDGLKPLADCWFAVTNAEKTLTLKVVNPIVDTPTITDEVKDADASGLTFADADLQKSYSLTDPDEKFPWYDYVDMGCRTDKWSKAELVDDMDDRLAPISASDVSVFDSSGATLTQGVDYKVSIQDDPEKADYNKVVVTFLPKGSGANPLEWLECQKFVVKIETSLRAELVDPVNYPETAFGQDYQELVDPDGSNTNHLKHRPELNYAEPGVVSAEDTGNTKGIWVEAYPPAEPFLKVAKSADPVDGSRILPGQLVTYTLAFDNSVGTAPVAVDFSDSLAGVLDDAALVSAPAAGPEDGNDLDVSALVNGVFRVSGTVPAGKTWTAVYQVRVLADSERTTGDGRNTLVNWMYATPDQVDPTCDPDVDECELEDPPVPPADPEDCVKAALCTAHFVPELVVQKDSDPADGSRVLPGEKLAYTLTFDNTAGEAAADVDYLDLLADVLDAAGDPSAITAEPGLTAVYLPDAKALRITGSVPAGEIREVVFEVAVKADGKRSGNSLDNWLVPTPDCGSGPCAPVEPPEPPAECPITGTGSELCTVHTVPELVVAKKADPPSGSQVQAGDVISYMLTFSNLRGLAEADVDWVDALNRVLDDADLVGPPAVPAGWTLDWDDSAQTLRIVGTLQPGEELSVSYQVRVKEDGARGDDVLDNWLVRTLAEAKDTPDECPVTEKRCTTHEVPQEEVSSTEDPSEPPATPSQTPSVSGPDDRDEPDGREEPEDLPFTGADVAGAVMLAAALLAGGVLLLRRRPRR